MRKPSILDLFCGAGGAATGYHRAGFRVVGVDIKPQPRYPFEFVQADALDYLRGLHERPLNVWYEAIHASPPCQFASKTYKLWASDHPDLIGQTRELLEETGLPYVIENVPGAWRFLNFPVRLEGQHFGLNTHRPRLFEANWPLEVPALIPPPPRQAKMGRKPLGDEAIQVIGHFADVAAGRQAMGIDWMTRDELAQAIPPAYTELIGHQLLQHLRVTA